MCFWGSTFHFFHGSDYRRTPAQLFFLTVCVGSQNSDPHACEADALWSDPSLQPLKVLLSLVLPPLCSWQALPLIWWDVSAKDRALQIPASESAWWLPAQRAALTCNFHRDTEDSHHLHLE